MLRFSINLFLLFSEHPFVERFGHAADAGLDTVEFWWPRGEDLDAVAGAIADAGVGVALINFDAGDMAAGDRGLLSHPNRFEEFRANVPVALAFARGISCTRLNALVGTAVEGIERERQLDLAAENVRYAADRAAEQGATIVIEAVNTIENPGYLLSTTAEAAAFRERVDRENVRLLYDAYHMQRMEGDLVATIRAYLDRIAHIQIADSPDRHEPGTGEIDYGFVLSEIERSGYDGFVGLEYKPRNGTLASLGWLESLAAS